MKDFSLRLAILEEGLDIEYARALKKARFQGDRSELDTLLDERGTYVCTASYYAWYSRWAKERRCKSKTADIVSNGSCVFLTLTFRDDVLAKTSEDTRRKYVRRFLKKHAGVYVANIDFGTENEREHYHAIANCGFVDPAEWKYGFIWIERVRTHKSDLKRVVKYVAKLYRHAMKETTKRGVARRLIYSRSPSTVRV